MTQPWKPEHVRKRTSIQTGRDAIFHCELCGSWWPCPGHCEEMRQVLGKARELLVFYDTNEFPLWSMLESWRDEMLLPVLAAGG